MNVNIFSISQVMFMLDVMKEDRERWCKFGNDEDVINEYDAIIDKLRTRIEEHNGMRKAITA
jgi:hypothetical protein